MLLQGNPKEFSLPNIFQLVKMSAKSGALTIRRGEDWGKIFFRNGLICYAFAVPQHLPWASAWSRPARSPASS